MEDRKCRIAGDELIPLFSLGKLQVSDFVENSSDTEGVELKLGLSKESGLVQLYDTADFDAMYSRYWYHSGINDSMIVQLCDIVESIKKVINIEDGDIWVDIGCNDGTLMSYVPFRCEVLGFDPAKNNCEQATKYGTVINNYFNAEEYPFDKRAKVITSIAMFYDLENPISFCNDIHEVLDDEGLWVIQLSYLPLMLEQLAFDNICHEHLEYYTLKSLEYLLKKTGFKIVDFTLNDTNGGSCRVFVMKEKAKEDSFSNRPNRDVCNFRIQSIRNYEESLKLDTEDPYLEFFQRIEDLKAKTVAFIKEKVSLGKSVWGYGASTKGNTLLQYFGLDHTLIQGIAERSPNKFGLKTIGSNIPIVSEEEMRKHNPDYLLILPWHFIDGFITREQEYLKQGGKFIVPCPEFTIKGLENEK
jgi:hypothetical protein